MDVTIKMLPTSSHLLGYWEESINWAETIDLAYAWITDGNAHWDMLVQHHAKIRHAVVGAAYHVTSPSALLLLHRQGDVLRVLSDTRPLFHPKLAIFYRGGQARAIIGSSNLTGGGFGGNVELNVFLEGQRISRPFAELQQFIEDAWTAGSAVDASWLRNYEAAWASKRMQTAPEWAGALRAASVVQRIADLNISWLEFVRAIWNRDGAPIAQYGTIRVAEYLELLDRIRGAWHQHQYLSRFTREQRDLVSGLGGALSWWFGRYTQAFYFRSAINEHIDEISAIMDRVPFHGQVSEEQVRGYFETMLDVRGLGIATASRLLAMRRPDWFLPVNRGNRDRLIEWSNIDPQSSVDNYLQFHEGVWDLPWWTAADPQDPLQSVLWHGRVALLDVLAYDPL